MIGQSGATALLVQRYFGGKIASFSYSNRQHYVNLINGRLVDLTCCELQKNDREYYCGAAIISENQHRRMAKYEPLTNILDKNCIEAVKKYGLS